MRGRSRNIVGSRVRSSGNSKSTNGNTQFVSDQYFLKPVINFSY